MLPEIFRIYNISMKESDDSPCKSFFRPCTVGAFLFWSHILQSSPAKLEKTIKSCILKNDINHERLIY